MNNELYPHNQEAYEKVLDIFKTKDRVCVIQPTGSGKSLIIASVCNHFNNVLILAPNNIILDQVKQNFVSENIPTLHTYAYLLKHELTHAYDLIVLDEFHRVGAQKWGEAVNKILENNPQAKVLGCSATPIRKSEGERNMAEELFNSNIASYITINNAIQNNILPSPIYVIGLVDFDSVYKRVQNIIHKSRIISEKEKARRIKKLDKVRLAWISAKGMPQILRKYVPKKTQKMLVFCDHITSIDKAKKKLRPWFRDAKLPLGDIYSIHSKMSDTEVREKINAFKNSKTKKGISIMVSVNMLNEGIHIPDVDVVLLLRKTQSSIIYLQQIGRCLLANMEKNPVILDMVDNIYNSKANWLIPESKNEDENPTSKKRRKTSITVSKFEVHDLLKDTKCLIEELTQDIIPNLMEKYVPFEKRLARVYKFIEEKQRLPKNDRKNLESGEYEEYLNWQNVMQKWKTDKRVESIVLKYGALNNPEIAKFKLITFIERAKRFPSKSRKVKNEKALAEYFYRNKEEMLTDNKIYELYQKYNTAKDYEKGYDYLYSIVENYCQKYNRLPTIRNDIESKRAANAYTYLKTHYASDEKLYNLRVQYSKNGIGTRGNRTVEIVKNFIETHGYLPYSSVKHTFANAAWNRLKYYFTDPYIKSFVNEITSKYKRRTKEKIREDRSKTIKESWVYRR